MNWILIPLCITVGVLFLACYAERLRISGLQKRIRDDRRGFDRKLARIKEQATAEIRRLQQDRRMAVDALRESHDTSAARWQDERNQLTAQLIHLADRPTQDISALIEAIGSSVAKVAYGPAQQPLTEDEVRAKTLNLMGDLNGTAGVKEGEWMPDVELDEWMEEHGMPSRPGAVAGTGPPQMPATPDSYLNVGDDLLPPQVVGLASAQRSNVDQRVFRSGDGAAAPPAGGVE